MHIIIHPFLDKPVSIILRIFWVTLNRMMLFLSMKNSELTNSQFLVSLFLNFSKNQSVVKY